MELDSDQKVKSLQECYNDAKSDKGARKHFYNEAYEPHFEKFRYAKFNFLEIGILKGASIEAHLDYFPNANLYAIDTFERKPPNQIRTCNEPDPRFKWLQADSTDPNLTEMMKTAWGDIEFDLIVDDGAHWFDMQRLTFKNCHPLMSKKGKYFIEDMWPLNWLPECNDQRIWQLYEYPEKFGRDKFNLLMESIDHMKQTHYDLRSKPKGHRIGRHVPYENKGKPYLVPGEWIGDSTILMLENQ